MAGDNNDKQAIDLSSIDWNKLSSEEYHGLEKRMLERNRAIKQAKPRKPKELGTVTVKISGKNYQIKQALFLRLQALRSQKSKQKLIDEIVSTHQPIEEI